MKLLKFPSLVLFKILRTMEPVESYDIAHCSQKVGGLVKQAHSKFIYLLALQLDTKLTFAIKSQATKGSFETSLLTEEVRSALNAPEDLDESSCVSTYSECGNIAVSYWQNWDGVLEEASSQYRDFMLLFKFNKMVVLIMQDKVREEYSTIVDWIQRIQSQSTEKLLSTMDSIEKNVYYFVTGAYQTAFPNITQEEKQAVKNWEFEDSYGMTARDVLSLNCISLKLHNSSLSDFEMNILLRLLVNGSSDNLEVAEIRVPRMIDIATVFGNIDVNFIEPGDVRRFERYGYDYRDEVAYRVVKRNGTACSVAFLQPGEGFETMLIIVWKEDN